jgi:hypothetical protein
VRTIVRTGIGFALFAGGMTFLIYGIAQAIANGSCGTDEYGNSVGPACPAGFGPMIVLMIGGTFAAIVGVAVAARSGRLIAGFVGAAIVAAVAGVVLGFVDLDDADTRPGVEIIVAVIAPLALFAVPAIRVRGGRATGFTAAAMEPPVVFATPPPPAAAKASADEIAGRLRQLDQLRDAGLVDDAAYKERRTQILAEL